MDKFTPIHLDDMTSTTRRQVLRVLGASAVLAAGSASFTRTARSQPAFGATPFTLGVASGDPAPDGFVIWTRLAPQPLEPGGGMPRRPVEVGWTVARDEAMREVVQKGTAIASPELGHAVHVELAGLEPARDYFYQFAAGRERSPVGRSRTFPVAGAAAAQLRFGVAGCQRYEAGYFTAYRHMVQERLDFVFHYGDYIYEYRSLQPGKSRYPLVRALPGEPGECFTLDDYRRRYATYQLDADLQAAHASAPFIVSFDDHEVANNWAADVPAKPVPRAAFLRRRAAAFQAWYEHMPVRQAQLPAGPDVQMYRRLAFGDLLAVNVLDTRQYRSPQACGGGTQSDCAEAREPQRTMLGEKQERWLYESFRSPAAKWTLLAQQVPMIPMDRDRDPAVVALNMDKWNGAVAARDRLLQAVEQAKLRNLVVVDGDVHLNCAGELKKDFADAKSPALGVEFVATSISSEGDGYDISNRYKALLQQDRHIKFYNLQRGYVRHVVTPQRWQADFRVLDKVSVHDGKMSTRKSFVVESGNGRLQDA